MVSGFLETYAARKALDIALSGVASLLRGFKSTLACSPADIGESITRHLSIVQNWAAEVTFADSLSTKLTQRVFVELDCYVIPRGRRLTSEEKIEKVRFDKLFEGDHHHIVFLGTPGAGKTTSMKHLCYRVLLDEHFAKGRINYPIVVKLRELNGATGMSPLAVELITLLGLKFSMPEDLERRTYDAQKARSQMYRESVTQFLNDTKALLVLDGFDEIVEAELRKRVLDEVRQFAVALDEATIVMTSRTGGIHLKRGRDEGIRNLLANQRSDSKIRQTLAGI